MVGGWLSVGTKVDKVEDSEIRAAAEASEGDVQSLERNDILYLSRSTFSVIIL